MSQDEPFKDCKFGFGVPGTEKEFKFDGKFGIGVPGTEKEFPILFNGFQE